MQPTQDFNAQNLLWMRGRRLQINLKTSLPKTKEDWEKLVSHTEEMIATGQFKYKGIYTSVLRGKKLLSTNNVVDALVLRKINDNIRRAYGIRQTQRSHAIKLAQKALAEYTPKGIVRIDLKSCFESITPQRVLTKLKADGRVSHQTIHLLESFFKQAKVFGSNHYTKGLPRGVVVSSTLAELYLTDLDRHAYLSEGLYVYIRYVDDIIAIAAKPAAMLHADLNTSASKLGLRLNPTKTELKLSGCSCAFGCTHSIGTCPCNFKCQCDNTHGNLESIDYLGYKLVFATGKAIAKGGACYALIADKKIVKLKSRVCAALNDYRSTKDLGLLLDRLRFLTRNVEIDHSIKGTRLLSGLAFTHDQYSEPPAPHEYETATISNLDAFLRTKARRLAVQHGLPDAQLKELLRHSFAAGHRNRHRASFHPARLKAIRSCWTNA